MTIYHIKRDYRMSVNDQKKRIREEFQGVAYISSDGRGTITVFAEGRKNNEVSGHVE